MTGDAFELGKDGARSVVVGVDGSVAGERAAYWAAGIARREHSQLIVVYARHLGVDAGIASPEAMAAGIEGHDAVETDIRRRIEASDLAVEVRLVVRNGTPVHVLAEVAEECAASMVVLGTPRSLSYLRPNGSVPVQLIRKRRWPVVVVP